MREYLNQIILLPDLSKQKEIAETVQSMRQKAQNLIQQGKELLAQSKKEMEKMILNPYPFGSCNRTVYSVPWSKLSKRKKRSVLSRLQK